MRDTVSDFFGIPALEDNSFDIKALRASMSKTQFLLIDFQKDFCDPAFPIDGAGYVETGRSARQAASLQSVFRDAGVVNHLIYFPNDDYGTKTDFDDPEYGFYMVQKTPDDLLTYKDTNSVFASVGFSEKLQAGGIQRLIISGVNLESCVKETALDALNAGYDVCILEDCVANDTLNYEEQASDTLSFLGKQKGVFILESHDFKDFFDRVKHGLDVRPDTPDFDAPAP